MSLPIEISSAHKQMIDENNKESSFDIHVGEGDTISQLYAVDKPSPSDLKRLRKELVNQTRDALKDKGIGFLRVAESIGKPCE